MFTPSNTQIIELGFKYSIYGVYELKIGEKPFQTILEKNGDSFFIKIGYETRKIYPKSINNLKTLIRLLSPNN